MTKAFQAHNHTTCREKILRDVEARAESEGLRLTSMRRRVLCILLENHHAMGAYDILNRLVAEGEPAQPPIVYRALSFLAANGFVHKVESQNAYIACQYPAHAHSPGFLICRECRAIGEHKIDAPILDAGDFFVETQTIEAEGLCQKCKKVDNATH